MIQIGEHLTNEHSVLLEEEELGSTDSVEEPGEGEEKAGEKDPVEAASQKEEKHAAKV